jgi:ATP-dependent DNA helicase
MKAALATIQSFLEIEQLLLTEVEVAALLRDRSIENEDRWVRAENFGLAVIANLEEQVHTFNPDDVDGVTEKLLTLAAHVLWSAAQRRFLLEDVYEATFLALNAAIAFLYAANLSGATAIAQEIKRWPLDDQVFALLRSIIETLKLVPDPEIPRKSITVEGLRRYYRLQLHHGTQATFDLYTSTIAELGILARDMTAAQIALVYRLEQAFAWLAQFLLPDLLEQYLGERNKYTEFVRMHGPFFAFPSQRKAILQLTGQPQANTLITYPTSTGKTFLGELLAIEPLLRGEEGVAVYIAPYRAIVSQIVDRERHLIEAAGISFVRAMGGYMEGLADVDSGDRVFLVTTPEAFDYALRVKPEFANRLVSVAIDELHLLEQSGRGTLLECLIGRLRDLQQERHIRIIGLSAVISDTSRLQKWLDVPDSHVLRTSWTPARKRFEIQLGGNRAFFYGDASQELGARDSHQLRWGFSSGIPRIPYQADPRRLPAKDRAYDRIADRAAYMAAQMYIRFGGSILVVCSSKRDTRIIARKLLNHIEPNQEQTTLQQRLRRLIEERYPHHRTLLAMLPYQVCYHNADIEYEVRDLLQKLIEERYFKVVVATTTLAEGVDLPFRAVIMYRWTHRENKSRKLFSTLLMRNIVGRCGRAGMFVEGDTIFYDNPTDDPSYNDGRIETIEQGYIYPETIRLRSSLETESAKEIVETDTMMQMESALLALINQRQPVAEPVDYLSNLMFADSSSVTKFKSHLNEMLQTELDKVSCALVVANSPINLTEYGRAAVQTGLSIRSAAIIADNLTKLMQPYNRPSKKRDLIRDYKLQWNGWMDQAVDLLGDIRELKSRERPGTQEEFPLLVWGWYSGYSLPALLWILRHRKRDRNDPLVQWLMTPSEPNALLEEQIAEIQGFCDSYFMNSWTRILRAINVFFQFSTFDDREQLFIAYQHLISCILYGVSERLAIQLLSSDVGFPRGRTPAQILAMWYKDYGVTDLEEVKSSSTMPNPESLQAVRLDPLGISRLTITAASDICNWLIEFRQAKQTT